VKSGRTLVFSCNLTENCYKLCSFLHPWKGVASSVVTTIKEQVVDCGKDEGYVHEEQEER